MQRRDFLLASAAAALAKGATPNPTQKYLARIQSFNPTLRAVIEVNPDALSMAANSKGGPLQGVPILLKDNIDTADRMQTTAGSLSLAGSPPTQDAFLVTRLRAAGAVILGKTNMSEWANYRSTHAVSGWSGRGGQTRNPYALDRNPSGSSSGSAVAVAADLCAMAVGTETDGSVVSPASVNGIVGIKPTVGLISRSGIIPISASQDTAGPMARTVREAAILLSVLSGVDPEDLATTDSRHGQVDYTRTLDAKGLRGARLGIARKSFGFNADVDKLMEDCIAHLRREGAEIIDPVDLPPDAKISEPEQEVLLYEFKAGLNAYLKRRGSKETLASLIEFNQRESSREMPYFRQELFEQSEKKGPLSETAYQSARAECLRLTRTDGIDAAFAKHRLDALVAPTSCLAWLTDWINGDSSSGGCSTPPAVAGYPHITVPAGFVHGLPAGISFFGVAWSEPVLLRIAYGFEQTTKSRRDPQLLATARL
jgi:amidase